MVSLLENSIRLYPLVGSSERKLISPNFHGDYRCQNQDSSSSSSLTSLDDFEAVEEPNTNTDLDSSEHSHHSPNAESTAGLFRCKHCHFETECFKHLLTHGQNIHNQVFKKKFSCNKCPYSAAKRWKVIEHMKYHEQLPGITLYECQTCPFKAPWRHQLDRHIMFIHQNMGRKYKCHVCFQELQSKTLLRKHNLTHK